MVSTSSIAGYSAGQTSDDVASTCKPIFAMGTKLVENLFVGRRWHLDWESDGGLQTADGDHRRYRASHYRLADGHGHAS